MTLVHLHPELWKDLIKYDITLSISIHSRDPDYAKVMKPKLKIAKEWKKKGVRITLYDSVKEWNMVYKGDGKDIMLLKILIPKEVGGVALQVKFVFNFMKVIFGNVLHLPFYP